MTDEQARFRIYEGIVCLEIPSPKGGKWWDQGFGLGYTPFPIKYIKQVRFGILNTSKRPVLAVEIERFSKKQWVAINPPRSDMPGLMKRGLWPARMPKPYNTCTYTPWPDYAKGRPDLLKL